MTEFFISENEKEKFKEYSNILTLKNSITSDLIKQMLAEEELKQKDEKNLEIKNNINDKNFLYFPLKKIQPKSKTLKNLMKNKKHKNFVNSIKKKEIKEGKNKIKSDKIKKTKFFKRIENSNIYSKTDAKISETKDTIKENNLKISKLNYTYNTNKRKLSFTNKKPKNINDEFQENQIKPKCHSEEKFHKKNLNFMQNEEMIFIVKKDDKYQNKTKPRKQVKNSIYKEINNYLESINNKNNINYEKSIKDFDIFLAENDHFEINYSPEIQKTFDLFKKGNKYIKKYFYLPKYQNYSPKEIIKNLIFKDILSFLTPIEQYLFSKSNKESLIKYMKSKGAEAEILLDKLKNQKIQIEKILNKNQNIKLTKENFFNDNRLCQIFNLLNDDKYLDIFNDKTNIPDDNIIFVFKLFFLMIKGTDKLVELKNDIFWEKISNYFINHTNEFNKNDYLLGELVKKILEQKLDFSEGKLIKLKGIVDQIDLRQINPNTFKDISPTTTQFCFIVGYFLEFFRIIGKDWNPLENEYKELIQKINELIKKINKIGLYIVNLKYKK